MSSKKPKFSYYRKLTKGQKAVYDKSDKIKWVKLPNAERFYQAVEALEKGLGADDREAVADASERIVYGLCRTLNVPQMRIRVLATRPSKSSGELHGLYEWEEGHKATITVWMRTAKQKNVVAFRSFLRTIIHEFLHHLDYNLLRLEDSFHTKGFYSRESSIAKQLLGEITQKG
jgi:hypothetical protein